MSINTCQIQIRNSKFVCPQRDKRRYSCASKKWFQCKLYDDLRYVYTVYIVLQCFTCAVSSARGHLTGGNGGQVLCMRPPKSWVMCMACSFEDNHAGVHGTKAGLESFLLVRSSKQNPKERSSFSLCEEVEMALQCVWGRYVALTHWNDPKLVRSARRPQYSENWRDRKWRPGSAKICFGFVWTYCLTMQKVEGLESKAGWLRWVLQSVIWLGLVWLRFDCKTPPDEASGRAPSQRGKRGRALFSFETSTFAFDQFLQVNLASDCAWDAEWRSVSCWAL